MIRKRSTSFVSFILVAYTIVAPSLAGAAASLSESIFLTPSDLPKGFKMTEAHLDGLSDSPSTFASCHGQQSGLKVFQADETASLQRIVDICWTFPTAADAQKFFTSSSDSISESAPPIKTFTAVGQDCKAYGGENTMGAALGADLAFYNYYYIFRCGRVVVKIYGAEGPMATTHPTLAMLLPVAQAAALKCQNF